MLHRLTLEVERLLPPNQRREEEHFTKFEEFVTDLWKKQMGHVQRVPGGSFRGEESTQVVSKEVSGYCTDDNYLDEYSEPEDESSATTSWDPSEENSGGDEWVEGKQCSTVYISNGQRAYIIIHTSGHEFYLLYGNTSAKARQIGFTVYRPATMNIACRH